MPTISMFYGLIIRMYYFDNQQHKLPHIHVVCQGQEAGFDIASGRMIEGKISHTKAKLIPARIEIHREELLADWQLAVAGEPLFRIAPLR